MVPRLMLGRLEQYYLQMVQNGKDQMQKLMRVTDYASWEYSIFETISEDELKLFQTKDVEGFKLYIQQGNSKFPKKENIKGWAAAIERAINVVNYVLNNQSLFAFLTNPHQ